MHAASVRAVQTDLAYTTIATMLRKMEALSLVKHRNEGRSFVYSPAVAAAAVSRSMVDHLIDRVFEGIISRACLLRVVFENRGNLPNL